MENLYFHIEIWIVYKCLPKCVVANTVNKRVAPLSSHPTHLNPTLNKVTSWVLEIAFPQFCKPLQHLFHFYLFLLKFFFFCTFSFSLFSFLCVFFFFVFLMFCYVYFKSPWEPSSSTSTSLPARRQAAYKQRK